MVSGLGGAEAAGALVFQAGTARRGPALVSSGGRVLGVTALGEDAAGAVARAYEAVGKIHFDGAIFRRDIGAPDPD